MSPIALQMISATFAELSIQTIQVGGILHPRMAKTKFMTCGFTFPVMWIVPATGVLYNSLGRQQTLAIPTLRLIAITTTQYLDHKQVGARIIIVVDFAISKVARLIIVKQPQEIVCVAVRCSPIVLK